MSRGHLYLECSDHDLDMLKAFARSADVRYVQTHDHVSFENLRHLIANEQRAYRHDPLPTLVVAEFAPIPTLLGYLAELRERRVLLLFRQRAWSEAQLSAAHLVTGTLRHDHQGWQLDQDGRIRFYTRLSQVLRRAT